MGGGGGPGGGNAPAAPNPFNKGAPDPLKEMQDKVDENKKRNAEIQAAKARK
jgi:hypothetical protein